MWVWVAQVVAQDSGDNLPNSCVVVYEQKLGGLGERGEGRGGDRYLIISLILLSLLYLIPASRLLALFLCVCECVKERARH